MKSFGLLAAMAAVASAGSDKCRALVLSGGSNNGAWEAGVIYGLTHYGDSADYAWDVISGVSAGALNTAASAVWATGDEVNMSEWLSDTWANLTTHEVWTLRPGGIINAALNEPSIADDSPGLNWLTTILGDFPDGVKRNFVVSAVDTNTGDYITFTQDNVTFEELPQAAVSSASIPGIFPPQIFKGYVLMDGGTVWNSNVNTAVHICRQKGFDDPDIIVDLAVCSYQTPVGGSPSNNAFTNWQEARDIKEYYDGGSSVHLQARSLPDVTLRHYFQERNECPGAGGLSFNNSTTWCLQESGRNDAKVMLDIGQDNIQSSLDTWFSSDVLRSEWPYFRDFLDFVYPNA